MRSCWHSAHSHNHRKFWNCLYKGTKKTKIEISRSLLTVAISAVSALLVIGLVDWKYSFFGAVVCTYRFHVPSFPHITSPDMVNLLNDSIAVNIRTRYHFSLSPLFALLALLCVTLSLHWLFFCCCQSSKNDWNMGVRLLGRWLSRWLELEISTWRIFESGQQWPLQSVNAICPDRRECEANGCCTAKAGTLVSIVSVCFTFSGFPLSSLLYCPSRLLFSLLPIIFFFTKVQQKLSTREDIPVPPASPSPPPRSSLNSSNSNTQDAFTPLLLLADPVEISEQLTFLEFSGFSSVQPIHYVQYLQQKLGAPMDSRYAKQIMKNNKKVRSSCSSPSLLSSPHMPLIPLSSVLHTDDTLLDSKRNDAWHQHSARDSPDCWKILGSNKGNEPSPLLSSLHHSVALLTHFVCHCHSKQLTKFCFFFTFFFIFCSCACN